MGKSIKINENLKIFGGITGNTLTILDITGSGTSVNNLGIDANGHIVVGSTGSTGGTSIFLTGGSYTNSTGTLTLNNTSGSPITVTGFTTGSTGGGGLPIIHYVYLVNDASDQVLMGGVANHVYTLAQDAYNSADAIQKALSGNNLTVVIQVGETNDTVVGGITLSGSNTVSNAWNPNVYINGINSTVSRIGLISGTNGLSTPFNMNLIGGNININSIESKALGNTNGGAVGIYLNNSIIGSIDTTTSSLNSNTNGGNIIIGGNGTSGIINNPIGGPLQHYTVNITIGSITSKDIGTGNANGGIVAVYGTSIYINSIDTSKVGGQLGKGGNIFIGANSGGGLITVSSIISNCSATTNGGVGNSGNRGGNLTVTNTAVIGTVNVSMNGGEGFGGAVNLFGSSGNGAVTGSITSNGLGVGSGLTTKGGAINVTSFSVAGTLTSQGGTSATGGNILIIDSNVGGITQNNLGGLLTIRKSYIGGAINKTAGSTIISDSTLFGPIIGGGLIVTNTVCTTVQIGAGLNMTAVNSTLGVVNSGSLSSFKNCRFIDNGGGTFSVDSTGGLVTCFFDNCAFDLPVNKTNIVLLTNTYLNMLVNTAIKTITGVVTDSSLIGSFNGSKKVGSNIPNGFTFKIKASGYYSTAAVPGTLEIKLTSGGVTIVTTTAIALTPSLTGELWEYEQTLTKVGVGAFRSSGGFKNTTGTFVENIWKAVSTTDASLSTDLDILATFDTAGNTLVVNNLFIDQFSNNY